MILIAIVILIIWELYWTVMACWMASKRNEFKWFVFMLVFNLLGIPEIYYIYSRDIKKEKLNKEQ